MTLNIYHFNIINLLIFQQNPNGYGIGGACLISLTLFVSGIKKVIEEKLPQDHPLKTKYLRIFFSSPKPNITDKNDTSSETNEKNEAV